MDKETEESRKRNQQTLNMLVSFPPEKLDEIMGAIAQDVELQGIEITPPYDSSKPALKYGVFERGTEIASIAMLNKRYTCILASEEEKAKRLRRVLGEYSK